MLQREVAVRLAAPPGGRDYGRLDRHAGARVAVERLFDVGPGAFQPPPRVWSAVVRLTVRAQPLFAVSPHYAPRGRGRVQPAPQDAAQRPARAHEPRKHIERLRHRSRGAPGDRLAPQDFNALAQSPRPRGAPDG